MVSSSLPWQSSAFSFTDAGSGKDGTRNLITDRNGPSLSVYSHGAGKAAGIAGPLWTTALSSPRCRLPSYRIAVACTIRELFVNVRIVIEDDDSVQDEDEGTDAAKKCHCVSVLLQHDFLTLFLSAIRSLIQHWLHPFELPCAVRLSSRGDQLQPKAGKLMYRSAQRRNPEPGG